MSTDLRTQAIVLRRTNYGESDRILNLLTPQGKIGVMARGVRKSKSRLAGGIELFTVADVVIHQGRANLGTLTSATMLQFYGGILNDVDRLELAGELLKKLDRASEQITNPEHFSLLRQALHGLNQQIPTELVNVWFKLNLARTGGEELNLLYDSGGQALNPELNYSWDPVEKALTPDSSGQIGASEIKFMRFILTNPLMRTAKIESYREILPKVTPLTKTLIS